MTIILFKKEKRRVLSADLFFVHIAVQCGDTVIILVYY